MAQRARQVLTAKRLLFQSLLCGQETRVPALLHVNLGTAQLGSSCAHLKESQSRRLLTTLADQQLSVIAPASPSGPILRPPVYAIFELGSKQYKVSPGDVIWVERLKNADVGTQIALSRVQLAGSQIETIVGRPYIENASVTAVVEVSPCLSDRCYFIS